MSSQPSVLVDKDSHSYTPGYRSEQLKTLGWDLKNVNYNFVLTEQDVATSVMPHTGKGVLLKELATQGFTKETAQADDNSLWTDHDQISGREGHGKEHAFENIYQKIACCMGTNNTLRVPLITNFDPETGTYEIENTDISFDTSDEKCTIKGVNYKDSNAPNTGPDANPHCIKLIQKIVAVMNKYDHKMLNNNDPDSQWKKIVGCFNLQALPKTLRDDPARLDAFLGQPGHANRTAFLDNCTVGESYLGPGDRGVANITICSASVGAGLDISADEAALILKDLQLPTHGQFFLGLTQYALGMQLMSENNCIAS